MRLFRSPEPVNPNQLMANAVVAEMQPPDPHGFVDQHGSALLNSANSWSEIASKIKDYPAAYNGPIKKGLIDVWEANTGDPLPDDEILQRDSEKAGSQLSVYCLVAARHFSGEGVSMSTNGKLREHFLHIPDHTVNYILRSKAFPLRSFLMKQVFLISSMANADANATSILTDLANSTAKSPTMLQELSGIFDNDASKVDERYRELQQMVATDWYHPDPTKSILRNFCELARSRGDMFARDFTDQVIQDQEKNHQLVAIRNMAHFAIVAQGGLEPVTAETIRSVLIRTSQQWREIPGLGSTFQAFVNGKVAHLEQHISTIAGPRNPRSLRTIPTQEEIERLKGNFTVDYTPDRQARRAAKRRDAKTFKSNMLPSMDDIEQTAIDPKERELTRKLSTLKPGVNGASILVESSIETLVEKFKIDSNSGLAQDISKMIDWILVNPVNSASRKLTGNSVRIRLNNRQLKLWRLAPEDATDIKINPANRYTRIVYAIENSSLIILDILDHDSFDKKYK